MLCLTTLLFFSFFNCYFYSIAINNYQLNFINNDKMIYQFCILPSLLLCRGVRPSSNKCPGYDTKQSDGEVPAVLELWGMWSTPLLASLPGPL